MVLYLAWDAHGGASRPYPVLVEALESLIEEADPLGLRVFWIKTNIQAFW